MTADLNGSRAPSEINELREVRLSLWLAPLDLPASSLRNLTACLSPEEKERAAGYRRRLERDRFAAARGWLRRLLAAQLLCAPAEVRFQGGDGVKPRVESSDLRFSASRSEDVSLFATSWKTEVGVDIEAIGVTTDVEAIAARFFSPGERRALASLPADRRRPASFQCWTCKEAYVKGVGAGLAFPIETIDSWSGGGGPASVSSWTIHQVEVGSGFAAAVAGEGLDGWTPTVPHRLGSPISEQPTGTIERLSGGVLGGSLEE
jgi:4'-phosphopantetheinyl transferase